MIGNVIQNRYRIDAELGRGGLGTVYRAYDERLGRAVAVKMLAAPTETTRQRLLREAQSAAQLNHPHIAAVYDVGESDGTAFIVQELVQGCSLKEAPPTSLDELVRIAEQICEALQHAHAHGIVHRDLKPENILLTPDGGPKLVDFGLAHSDASRLSTEGTIIGTVFYISPEQALGHSIDGRADLYALGVMLYELTTGRLPFTGDDPLAIISQHLYAPAVPPSTWRPDLPPALEGIILKLLAKEPNQRYASAALAAQALSESRLAAEPRTAPPSDTVALLDQLARGRLVARTNELDQLRGLWNRSQQGYGVVALISGEPGVGKTRLAREVMVYAQLNGAAVLRGGCYEYEATTPYLPLAEALREWARLQTAEERREHLGSLAPELARLAPEIESKLGSLPANPALSPNEERLRLFDNFVRFLQSLAHEHGLLFFIDDLHWADQGTLALLQYAARHLRDDRVMFLAAYRELELDRTHPLAAALVEWNRERLATRVMLGRLDLAGTGALIATLFGQEQVSPEFAQVMYRETEGNPFFVEEVIKALIEQGQIYREEGKWQRKGIEELAIPQSIIEAIGRRLNRLSTLCTETLHVAAALGKRFEFNELAAATTSGEDLLLNALDEAILAQLIRAESGEAFVFTHDKIREVLYEELNPIRRRRLHQRIGEGLERLYAQNMSAHVQDLAHHFTLSGDLQRALRYALLAAEKARALYALQDALQYYHDALESALALGANESLARVYTGVGEVYSLQGPVSMAVENYERAIPLVSSKKERGALKAKIGTDYMGAGDARGLAYIQAALEELDPKTQTNETALATAMIGRYHHYLAQHSAAIEHLERARALAEPLDDPNTLTSIYAYLSGAWQHLVDFDKSMEWARRCIALGERKQYALAESLGYEFLAEDSLGMGKWQDALDYSARDREIGEKTGALDRVAWASYVAGYAHREMGELAAAARSVEESLRLAERVGDTRLALLSGSILAKIQSDLGQHSEATANGERTVVQADELKHIYIQTFTRTELAYSYLRQGNWTRAVQVAEQALALISPTENRWARLGLGPILAEAWLRAGRVEDGIRMSTESLALTRQAHDQNSEGIALRVQGQLLMEQKDWETAARRLDEAVSLLDRLGSRPEAARALQVRGDLRDKMGNDQKAREDWQRSYEILVRCGMRTEAEKVRAVMERGGAAQPERWACPPQSG